MIQKPHIIFAETKDQSLKTHNKEIVLPDNCTVEFTSKERDFNEISENKSFQILVIDLDFCEKQSPIDLLSDVKRKNPNIYIVPIIPLDQTEIARDLLHIDIFHFIHKPIDAIEITIALKKAVSSLPIPTNNEGSSTSTPQRNYHGMIGATESMSQLFDLISKIADDDLSTVLIRGESGTGKEMVAKAIHAQSKRKKNNFVPVNCAAIPDDLLESELFGYTKGAFTGATTNKLGRIQYADNGTLFLDEIGDMKATLQAKLLRVIQEKEFEPVGAFKSIPVNTRILAATHCDLEQLVAEGQFREDLYYRLSVIPVYIPSLKERSDDIPILVEEFIQKYSCERGKKEFSFSKKAATALKLYDWRGNVRELENLIQHMSVLFSGQVVQFTDLPPKFHDLEITEEIEKEQQDPLLPSQESQQENHIKAVSWEEGNVDFKQLINDFETELIVQALRQTNGNKKEAARLLNLKRTTLLEKIKKKDIDGLWNK